MKVQYFSVKASIACITPSHNAHGHAIDHNIDYNAPFPLYALTYHDFFNASSKDDIYEGIVNFSFS
jgi:hypothetical protein